MPRLKITISKRTDTVLREYSDKTSAPVSALIREAIAEWAQKRGIDLRDDVSWGGVRYREYPPPKQESDEGQQVGMVKTYA